MWFRSRRKSLAERAVVFHAVDCRHWHWLSPGTEGNLGVAKSGFEHWDEMKEAQMQIIVLVRGARLEAMMARDRCEYLVVRSDNSK